MQQLREALLEIYSPNDDIVGKYSTLSSAEESTGLAMKYKNPSNPAAILNFVLNFFSEIKRQADLYVFGTQAPPLHW